MQNFVHPIEILIHTTVRIECTTPIGATSGSGYFFSFDIENNNVPCIVTNKHVISNAVSGKFYLSLQGPDGKPDLGNHAQFCFNNFEQMWHGHPDPSVDLAIFFVGPILNAANNEGKPLHLRTINKEIIASEVLLDSLPSMEEIIMIGYPNGIWDSKHNLPIIRRGITATHPKLPCNGKPEFLIDAACFPGSSGSPVFLANIGSYMTPDGSVNIGTRIALLGTLYAGPQHTATGEVIVVEVPTDTRSLSISSIPNNLGLVIQASKLLDFEPLIKTILKGTS